MDDWMEKLQAILSDPESLQNLSELAGMLHTEGDPDPAAATDAPSDPPFDLTKLLALGAVFSGMQADENTALLLALKPHLQEKRAKRVDRAIQLLRIYQAVTILKENGMLSDLLDKI